MFDITRKLLSIWVAPALIIGEYFKMHTCLYANTYTALKHKIVWHTSMRAVEKYRLPSV